MVENETKEYEANWEGTTNKTNFQRTVIPQDSYNAVKKMVEIITEPSYNNKEILEEKIKLILALNVDGKEIEFVHKINPKISKGSTNATTGKTYANSKLYDLLVDLNLKDKFKEVVGSKFKAEQVADFIRQEIGDKVLRVSVETKKANTPEAYSRVTKILRFV